MVHRIGFFNVLFAFSFLLVLAGSVSAENSSLLDGLDTYFSYDLDFNSTFPLDDYSPLASKLGSVELVPEGINSFGANFSTSSDNLRYYNNTGDSSYLANWCNRGNTGSFSVSMWALFHDDTIRPWLIEAVTNGYISETIRFYYDTFSNPHRLYLHIRPNTGTDVLISEYDYTFNLKEFYQLGFSYNSTDDRLKMYINGVVVNVTDGSVRWAGNYPQGCEHTVIGNDKNDGGAGKVTIDEVGIWNRTLNETEFSKLYNNSEGFFYPFEAVVSNIPPLNGSGTVLDPYKISKCEHFYNISYDPHAKYELINDIDCSNISELYSLKVSLEENSSLSGNNYTISNYYLNNTNPANHRFCGFFKNVSNATIQDLIINNFTISCYNPTFPNYFESGGFLAEQIKDDTKIRRVAIKNSVLDVTSCLGSMVNTENNDEKVFINDTYLFNVKIHPHTIFGVDDICLGAFGGRLKNSVVRNSWSDTDFKLPQPCNANCGGCFAGATSGGIFTDNYFNNETCNTSIYTLRGAVGITSSEFKDPSNTIWADYSSDVWYFEAGQYPIFTFEYEKQPRPEIISPESDLNISYNDLTIYYTVEDTDSISVDCDLYLDGSINQTGIGVSPGSNQSFDLLNLAEGSHIYYVGCTDGQNTRYSEAFSVTVDTLEPVILSLNPEALNDSMLNYTFTVIGNISDVNYLSSNYSLYYPNGSLLWYNSNNTWNKSFDVTPIDGIYNIKISAIDSFNNSAMLDISFFINDTVPPICYGFDSVSVSAENPYTWSGSCIDERMIYSFNISCEGQTNYNYTEIGINQSIYQFTQSHLFPNGSSVCSWQACDGHTAKKLHKDKWYVRDSKHNQLETEFEGKKNKITTADDSEFTYEILEDRISFNIEFQNKKDTNYIIYYETSENSNYYLDPEYKAWIIDYDSKTWFDLNSPDNDFTIDVIPWNKTTWRIEIIPSDERSNVKNGNNQKDLFRFNSIGELNCISGIQNFTSSFAAEPPYTEIDEVKGFSSLQEAAFYIFIYLIWMAFLLATFVIHGRTGHTVQLFNLVQAFLGIMVGIMFFKFSLFFGLVTLLVAASISLFKFIEG